MKISLKCTSNFHATRIKGQVFLALEHQTAFSDMFFMSSLWENSQTAISGELERLKTILDFFVIKYFWFRVVTYLWEREI